MGVPQEVLSRVFDVGDVVGLIMRQADKDAVHGFRIRSYELTTIVDFSLGSASALATAGTGFSQIQDSANRFLLQPQQQEYFYQVFYGISPSYAWVYRAYPPNQNRGGLVVPPAIGGQVGYFTGKDAPYNSASLITEFVTMYGGLQPAFNGYLPYGVPASITVYMNFWIWKYAVTIMSLLDPDKPQAGGSVPKRTIPVGGTPPAPVPQWVLDLERGLGATTMPAAAAGSGAGRPNVFR